MSIYVPESQSVFANGFVSNDWLHESKNSEPRIVWVRGFVQHSLTMDLPLETAIPAEYRQLGWRLPDGLAVSTRIRMLSRDNSKDRDAANLCNFVFELVTFVFLRS